MSNYVSQTKLAEIAGTSRQNIGKLTKTSLAAAVHNKKIDVTHPDVIAYLSKRQADEAEKQRPKSVPMPKITVGDGPEPSVVGPSAIGGIDMETLQDMTVREVMLRFGTMLGFEKFVKSMKDIADYRQRELKLRIQRGELVDREEVRGQIFGLLDVGFKRLVTDVPEALTQQVIARVESGETGAAEEITEMIRDANSRALKNSKDSIMKNSLIEYA